MGSYDQQNSAPPALRYIPLSYSPANSQSSALRLILTLIPEWEGPDNKIEFVRFTEGITNTVCLSTGAPFAVRSRGETVSALKMTN